MLTKYQTDFDGYIRDDGCCLFSILGWSCKLTSGDLTERQILVMIDELHEKHARYSLNYPAIGNEQDPAKPGVFVYDHEVVFDHAFKFLGSSFRVKYTGRIYMPWEEERGKESFGKRSGNILIFQVKTVHGNGHFQTLFYNPWNPAPEVADLKSIRYYLTY